MVPDAKVGEILPAVVVKADKVASDEVTKMLPVLVTVPQPPVRVMV